jgi:hypothetical protein
LSPEEHRAICQETGVRKSWLVKSTLVLGEPPNQFRVHLKCTVLKCGHRITTREREALLA